MENSIKVIYLIGFMGCGKTTIGINLAKTLGWKFIDMDNEIELKEGVGIPEIFQEKGEKYFRLLEVEALQNFKTLSSCVIATGGGAPCFYDNIETMNKNGLTIYLKLSPAALTKRLMEIPLEVRNNRPLLANKSEAELLGYIQQMLNKRNPFYSKAKLIIENENKIATALDGILQFMNGEINDF